MTRAAIAWRWNCTRNSLESIAPRLNISWTKHTKPAPQGKGTAGKLLTDPSAADELQTLLAKANRSMDELQVTLTNLQSASGNLQIASTNLPAITDAIGQEAKDLPGLVLQTQTSMREMERLIEAMQRHWLLRKYVNRTNPPPIRPLTETAEPERKPVKAFQLPRDSTK